jgi:hypothetical protein
MVPCLFFSFAELFDFGWCFLAQEMSLVVSYLPYFRKQVITLQLSAFLSFQHLFTEVHMEISSLLLPLSLVCFQSFHPLCCVFSLLYIIQICLFVYLFFVEDQSAQRAMLVYPRGGWRNTA